MSSPDRLNRGALLVLGVVTLAAGAAGVLAGTGVFGAGLEHQHLYSSHAAHFVGRHGRVLWPAAAGVSLLLALLALGWLRAQGARPKVRTLLVASGPGGTTITGRALTDAIAADIGSVRGVRSVSAGLHGQGRDPRLQLDITVEARADLRRVRDRVETGAVVRARAAMAPIALPTRIDYDVSTKAGKRT